MSSIFAGFHNVNNIGDKPLVSQLEDNLKSFLDYSFIKIGGFINVSIPTNSVYGGDFATLKPSQDPARPANTVWETTRKDWVYESGICHNGRCPTAISGVYINNSFVPGPTGASPNTYTINYPMGQVIFNTPQLETTSIKLNYSYRYIQTYKANESIWWKELQKLSYDPNTAIKNKGQIITANHRVQLPAIIIETIARTSQTPYELGNTKNIISQDILLHVYTENPVQRNSILDMLLLQKDRETFLYDINSVLKDNAYMLNNNGQINPNGLNYDQIISSSKYQKNIFYIENASISEMNALSESLYNGVVRWTLKIYP